MSRQNFDESIAADIASGSCAGEWSVVTRGYIVVQTYMKSLGAICVRYSVKVIRDNGGRCECFCRKASRSRMLHLMNRYDSVMTDAESPKLINDRETSNTMIQ